VADDSAAAGLGKLVLGGAVGFGLYLLITGLGFGGLGRGEGQGEVPLPIRPRDAQRLNFLLSSRGFESRDADWKPTTPPTIYTVNELIARVKDGGRADVALRILGSAIQRDVDAALAALKQGGIDVWKMEASPPTVSPSPAHVSGNARGEYGRRGRAA
jgi:hypothetical protein